METVVIVGMPRSQTYFAQKSAINPSNTIMFVIYLRSENLQVRSNEDFVNDLMTQSTYGQLMQTFVVEAIRFYSEKVASTPEPTDDSSEFISPKVWHVIATDVQKQFKETYEA